MEETDKSQEEKIIEAAIFCIERDGIQNVTTRKIAEAAGVNGAAINYYFRTKDRVIEKAIAQTVVNAFEDWEEFLDRKDLTLRQALAGFLEEFIPGAKHYPNLARAHLYGSFMEGDYDTPFARRMISYLDLISDRTAAEFPNLTRADIALRITQFVSSASFAAIFPGYFEKLIGGSVSDEEYFEAYSELLMKAFFAEN